MTTAAWVILIPIIVIASSVLSLALMSRRLDNMLAKERRSLSEARASIEAQKDVLEEMNRLRDEAVKKQSLDEFLADLHTEQRQFVREQKMLFATRKSLVLQERMYFRNIPLCNWVEHEVPFEEGVDVENLARTLTVFSDTLLGAGPAPKEKTPQVDLLDAPEPGPLEDTVIKLLS